MAGMDVQISQGITSKRLERIMEASNIDLMNISATIIEDNLLPRRDKEAAQNRLVKALESDTPSFVVPLLCGGASY